MDKIDFLNLRDVNALHAEDIEKAILRASRSGWYLNGAENSAFENAYAGYIGTRHCIGCANGLDALTLILRACIELGMLHKGEEIAVPANTYIATILAITENGLKPLLVEPDPSTAQISPHALEKAVTPETKALMTVHLYGRCSLNTELERIVRDRNLLLFEDNAQAHGCTYSGRRTGSFGLAAAHSFYPGKNLGALGDGGAVTTDNPSLAEAIRSLANYGSSEKYIFKYQGRNSRLDEIQAAVLNAKLKYLDADNERRRQIARLYLERLRHPDIKPLSDPDSENNVWHIFPIFSPRRDELQTWLNNRGVQTLIHYPVAPHKQECYPEMKELRLPVSERLHATELSLPISPAMTEEQAIEVIQALNAFPKYT